MENKGERLSVLDVDEDGAVPDLTLLSFIDEKQINTNLRLRYSKDKIYTCAGSILIAINPYKTLPIYGSDIVELYHSSNKRTSSCKNEPHVYDLTESAFSDLRYNLTNQSVVISGESGAGKTETAKFVLNYLCSVSSNISTWVQHQIIEANTVLEAFGNAKTVRNDNSSRFGKFMQVCFDGSFKISGCVIQDYLLELSRITVQSVGERNYHVFYQLLAGAKNDPELASQLMLKTWQDYNYTNKSGCYSIAGVDDAEKFDNLRLAFNVLQLSTEASSEIFSVLSGILWLGNIQFQDIDGEKCGLSSQDEAVLENIAKLLGLGSQAERLKEVLLIRQINVRGTITDIPLRMHEACENRHAMARILYSRTFSWLLHHINDCTNPGKDLNHALGILDIFGFENFEKNSFEQLCINYANEKLHRFFNNFVFALEQELYSSEGIEYSHIQHNDNSLCVELIEKPPVCILKLLSEQCHMPKGCDGSFITNLHSEFENHSYFIKGEDRRKWLEEFGIQHYAGVVVYSVDGFVDKNRDVQQEVFLELLSCSSKSFVQKISSLPEYSSIRLTTGTTARGTNKSKPTKSETFRLQLAQLVQSLQATNPWYIRCIKPNFGKQSNTYHDDVVLDQLRYLGMLDLIHIRKEGYPVHLDFKTFIYSYKCLVPKLPQKILPNNNGKDMVIKVLTALCPQTKTKDWQVGNTKVFLRLKVYVTLDSSRVRVHNKSACLIQTCWRRFVERRRYLKIRNGTLVLQHAFRGWKQRVSFLQLRRAAIVIQTHLRGMFAREVAAALREMRRVEAEEAKLREKEQLALQKEMETAEASETLEEISSISDQDNVACIPRSPADENHVHASEDEIHAAINLAHQLNAKLPATYANQFGEVSASTNGENVDLDNLFAFLSDIHNDGNKNAVLEEIENQMTNLATNFDQELSMQSELPQYSSGQSDTTNNDTDNADLPLPSPPSADECIVYSSGDVSSPAFGFPSLPEPTEKPPPPPVCSQDEPIYEAIKPRSDVVDSEEAWEDTLANGEALPAPPADLKKSDYDRECRRKLRVNRRLHELEDNQLPPPVPKEHIFAEFAEQHFNAHEYTNESSIVSTLRRNKKPADIVTITKQELTVYTDYNYIPTSHIVMYDHENIALACTIFKELTRYMKGDMSTDDEVKLIQKVVGYGIEGEEIRDEIYVMCMRQINGNPSPDATERLWILVALCVVAFLPSKSLFKYAESFFRKLSGQTAARSSAFALYCAERIKSPRIADRKLPPSRVEIDAMRRLGYVSCRVYFLDDTFNHVEIGPFDTAGDVVQRICESIGLFSADGWALFQGSKCGKHSHIKAHEYILDTISGWEAKVPVALPQSSPLRFGTLGRNASISSVPEPQPDCFLFFYRRLFRNCRELSEDPNELLLLYKQAVYSVVELDDFPINDKVSLQLAGLKLQVDHGDLVRDDTNPYRNAKSYLPRRITDQKPQEHWQVALAQAHQQYGVGKSDIVARVWYLSCVMHFPLYGISQFPVVYRGYWNFGSKLILGVGCDGLTIINPEDKYVICTYTYNDIESLFVDSSDDFITVTLLQSPTENHKCLVFETEDKEEIASLIVSYSPPLSYWLGDLNRPKKKQKPITYEDRLRRFQSLINCRKQLIDSGVLRKPMDEGNFFRSTLRRLNKYKGDKLRQVTSSGSSDSYKGFTHSHWAFTRVPLTQTLTKLTESDEKAALENFSLVLMYSGLVQPPSTQNGSEEGLISLAQTLLERSMKKECLFNELFLQLIKQTTDHPEANSRVNVRHWALLTLLCSIALPQDKLIRKYLMAHLKLCSSDPVSEEGKFAQFAEKCLLKTMNSRRRQWSPSSQEILCTINRRLIYARIYLMDGAFHAVEFEPTATASDVIEIIKSRIGLRSTSQGFALYEVLGDVERSLVADEKLTDVMGKWERYRNSGIQQNFQQHHAFLFKKHLFLDQYINFDDPVEKELLYFQMLHSIRVDRFPITEMEAIMICSLRAQIELGDYCPNPQLNYSAVIEHCLPPRILTFIKTEVVALHHQSLFGMTPQEAKQAFFNIIQSWPLHRATFYDVTQSFTSNWPKSLWLAVDQAGLHLIEHRTRNILCNYDYASLVSINPTLNCLMVVTGSDSKACKIILNTHQAFQISNLVREYCEVLQISTNLVSSPMSPVP